MNKIQSREQVLVRVLRACQNDRQALKSIPLEIGMAILPDLMVLEEITAAEFSKLVINRVKEKK